MGRFAARLEHLFHSWNAFDDTSLVPGIETQSGGATYGGRSDYQRFRISNERSIIASVYNRIGIDVAAVDMRHVRVDDDKQYVEDVDDGLNQCLTVEANLDQAGSAFRQDIAQTLFDEGVAVIVPVDTTFNPNISGSYDIRTMRVGRVVAWYPTKVRVSLYNENKGIREDILVDKKVAAIIENPLYSVMNEPNSTLRRLVHKLSLLDAVDEQSSSGKLDLIIQLPYVIKSETRKQQAEQRRKDIEFQLKGSKYGIAYTDGTEKITQLNRPAENNLLAEVTYLTTMLYGQLGITEDVLNGTADEKTMLNYYNRTIEPIVRAITEGMARVFLTKTARSQGQTIASYRDPFKFVPLAEMADIIDKVTRNEVMTANDIRAKLGEKPSKDPKANQLINSNMPQPPPAAPAAATDPNAPPPDAADDGGDASSIMQDAFGKVNGMLDSVFDGLGVDENAVS